MQELIICATCGLIGSIREGVVVLAERVKRSYFDGTFQKMEKGKIRKEDWDFFYHHQVQFIEKHLQPGMVVLDVGCGPSSPYKNHCDAFVIGLEASYDSIKFNKNIDLRVFGSATDIPLPEHSVDAIICLYCLHHITGKKGEDNRALIHTCFKEFARVLKPGGMLFVFEDILADSIWNFENGIWNMAKRFLSDHLDMYFYSVKSLMKIAADTPMGPSPEVISFKSEPFKIITPIFSLRGLRIFRWMYPLRPKLLKFVRL